MIQQSPVSSCQSAGWSQGYLYVVMDLRCWLVILPSHVVCMRSCPGAPPGRCTPHCCYLGSVGGPPSANCSLVGLNLQTHPLFHTTARGRVCYCNLYLQPDLTSCFYKLPPNSLFHWTFRKKRVKHAAGSVKQQAPLGAAEKTRR